jgi:hypothetical protein
MRAKSLNYVPEFLTPLISNPAWLDRTHDEEKGKSMKKTSMILAAAAALLATSIAFAAPPSFKKADTNGDGMVDASEYEATKAKRKMADLDKNGDGNLDKKEYSALFDEDCE